MSRGVLAIFGSISTSSMDTVISLTRTYNVPFIFWSNFAKSKTKVEINDSNEDVSIAKKINRSLRSSKFLHHEFEDMILSVVEINLKKKRNSHGYSIKEDLENIDQNTELENPKITFFNSSYNNPNSPMQLYLKPDLKHLLIELIRFYEWLNIYYIYNHDQGFLCYFY